MGELEYTMLLLVVMARPSITYAEMYEIVQSTVDPVTYSRQHWLFELYDSTSYQPSDGLRVRLLLTCCRLMYLAFILQTGYETHCAKAALCDVSVVWAAHCQTYVALSRVKCSGWWD